MRKRDILIIANKILGIYLLVRALEMLQTIGMAVSTLPQLSSDEGMQGIWFLIGSIVPFLLLIAAGLCLIKCADSFATKLCVGEKINDMEGNIERDVLQEIAFSTLGVFVIVNAIPRITQIIVNLSIQGQWRERVLLGTWGAIIGFVIQLAIGIFLIFGSKGLVGLLKKCHR